MPWNNQDDDDNKNTGPWGNRPSNGSGGSGGGDDGGRGDNNPWGNRGGRGGGPEGPDIDEVLQNMQNRMRNAIPGGGEGGKGLAFLILLLAGLWLATGFYRVQAEEHGVILTFGKLTDIKTEPGLGYHFPWPIQTLYKPNVTQQRRIEVGYRNSDGRGRVTDKVTDIPSESLMLTGDENIIDIDFVVVWQIKNAGDYLFQIRDPDSTIKKVAESAMREVIGQTPIQPALTEARQDIESRTLNNMQIMLDSYQAGVRIVRVQLQKVDPPSQVIDAFNEVQRARADRERLRNEAETYRNDVIPRARGEAEKMVQEAMAYREQVVNRAEGETNRFTSVMAAYSQAKEVTIHRIWLETMQDVLSKSNTILVDGESSGGVLPYLPLNELKKRAGASSPPQPGSYPQTSQR